MTVGQLCKLIEEYSEWSRLQEEKCLTNGDSKNAEDYNTNRQAARYCRQYLKSIFKASMLVEDIFEIKRRSYDYLDDPGKEYSIEAANRINQFYPSIKKYILTIQKEKEKELKKAIKASNLLISAVEEIAVKDADLSEYQKVIIVEEEEETEDEVPNSKLLGKLFKKKK